MSASHHSHLWLVCSDHCSPRSYCIPFWVPTDFLVTQRWAVYSSSLSDRSKDPSYPPGMKCKRTGILRSEEIAVSPNSKNDADKKASDVFKIICCSPERKSCIAFVQTHFVTSTLVRSQLSWSSQPITLIKPHMQWFSASGASTLILRASSSPVSPRSSSSSLPSASSVASPTDSSPFHSSNKVCTAKIILVLSLDEK